MEDLTVVFVLDKNNKIVDVNETWDRFAAENEGLGLSRPEVVNRNLFEFIHGDSTRMFVQVLLDYARIHQNTVERDYRCDSDQVKRFMKMVIKPQPDGTVLLENITLRVEKLDPRVPFRLAGPGQRGHLRCSMCNHLKFGDQWVDPADALRRGEVDSVDNRVTYSVCPSCRSSIRGAPS
nr:PAS domain-containing protein [Candidatus Krumholzibacteria bacterium]